MGQTKKSKKAKKGNSKISTALLFFIFIIGLSLVLYPSVSDWWNTRSAKKLIAEYNSVIVDLEEDDYSSFFEAADVYNQAIYKIGSQSAITDPDQIEGYEDLLDVTGTGIMGYITIDKINVEIPIYHGTSAGVLQVAAGHLEGTSLPVGGENTHCVISAHRGLPSAKLFTDLDQLEVGDTFTITVLDQVLTYEVDQISIVLPSEIENLFIEDGQDYCTLMTCTPYGINTHRLLVRGVRIETVNSTGTTAHVTANAYQVDRIIVATAAAVPLLFILLIWLLIGSKKKRKKEFKIDDWI